MTTIAPVLERLEVAGSNAAARLWEFNEALTPDERRALDLALGHLIVRPDDVAGFRDNRLHLKPSPLGCVLWQEQVRSLVDVLTFGMVSDFISDYSTMPPGQPA
jgi:hypothetical protein